MPTLNHANLTVDDVVSLRDISVQFFACTPLDDARDRPLAELRGEGGVILNIMRCRATAAEWRPEDIHIGFAMQTDDAARSRGQST